MNTRKAAIAAMAILCVVGATVRAEVLPTLFPDGPVKRCV